MNPRAQAGLEYLLSYGWALILIATIIGVVIFVITSPNQDLIFRSSDPTKILLKGAAALGEIVQIKLQNITGGKIRITAITSSDYQNLTLNGQTFTTPVEIAPGGEITIEATGTRGTITINYTDHTGIQRTATITATSQGGTTTEPTGTPITACGTNITQAGTYYLQDNLTTASGNCITINADDVTINGNGKTVTKTGGMSSSGIYVQSGQDSSVQGVSVTGFQTGIYLAGGTAGTTVSGNTANGNTIGVYGAGSDSSITGNAVSGNSVGIETGPSTSGNTVSSNTVTGNSSIGIRITSNTTDGTVSSNTVTGNGIGISVQEASFTNIQGNTVNSNNSYGIYLDRCWRLTITGNTANDNANAAGIYIQFGSGQSGDSDFHDNTTNGNYVGLQQTNSIQNRVYNHTASSNTLHGMVIENGNQNMVQDSTASGNGQEGIFLNSCFICPLTSNTVESNNYSGIKAVNMGQSFINSNTSCGNGIAGPAYKDFDCSGISSLNQGIGNFFDSVTACSGPEWPVPGSHYSPCP